MPASLKAITATALIGISTLTLSPPAFAGWGCGWGCGFGPALAGFGIGAIVGGALAGPPIYLGPPPPPVYYGPSDYEPYYGPPRYGPSYYGPVGYGPQPRTPDWYSNRSSPPSTTSPRATADVQRSWPSRPAKSSGPTGSQQKVELKFKAAQDKAKRDGVYALTKQDIEGLSPEQIRQLRGY
jgi:hypothetical protein